MRLQYNDRGVGANGSLSSACRLPFHAGELLGRCTCRSSYEVRCNDR